MARKKGKPDVPPGHGGTPPGQEKIKNIEGSTAMEFVLFVRRQNAPPGGPVQENIMGSSSLGFSTSGTLTPPIQPGTQLFLADEVANDAQLINLTDDVYWYPDHTSLATLFPYAGNLQGVFPGRTEFYIGPGMPNPGTTGFHGKYGIGPEIVPVPEFGVNALRSGSLYQPDHFYYDPGGGNVYATAPPSPIQNHGQDWLNARKYTYTPIAAPSSRPSSTVGWQTEPVLELWLRWHFMLESDIMIGMTEHGFKLGGMTHADTAGLIGGAMWVSPPVGRTVNTTYGAPGQTPAILGERRFALKTYWGRPSDGFNGDLNSWGSGPNSDQNTGQAWVGADPTDSTTVNGPACATNNHPGGTATRYMYPNVWHCLEWHCKVSSAPGVADGIREVWFDDELLINHVNCITHNGGPGSLPQIRHQLFHGGQWYCPSQQIHARFTGWCAAKRRIGSIKHNPTIQLNINNDSWASTWDDPAQRVNMEYSNAHQVPIDPGNSLSVPVLEPIHIEFAMAQHGRPPGDNVGIRWARFTSDQAPTGDYYTSNTDTQLQEGDNAPSCYLPWVKGVWLQHQKIVENITTTPTFRFKNNDGVDTTETFHSKYHIFDLESPLTITETRDNFNPVCLVNPAANATWSGYIGGGYGQTNYPNGHDPTAKMVKKNPSFIPGNPVSATNKPFIMKIWKTHKPAPTHMRHGVRIGNWWYWGGSGVYEDGPLAATSDFTRNNEFYRVNLSDFGNGVYNQESITPGPLISASRGLTQAACTRFCLLCADELRKWIIYINIAGVWRYKVPAGDGNNGVWDGPYTFGYSDWAATISEGKVDSLGNWHGIVGSHQPGMRQTFFRYNLSKRWNRIQWGVR